MPNLNQDRYRDLLREAQAQDPDHIALGDDWHAQVDALLAEPARLDSFIRDEAAKAGPVTDEMVDRFLSWPLPRDFAPDCGISFDGRKDDQWNKNKTWPIGTNLLTATQARTMLEHVIGWKP